MSEAGDYSPGVWAGHDFNSARKSYASHAAASFTKAVDRGVTVKDLVPAALRTESTNPIVIDVDQTGSMGAWPATMFSKLPYLEHEAKTEYMGEDTEISWAATGDAHNGENYPVQARPFTKGKALASSLKEIVLEGAGGGTTEEDYALTALYYARNVEMPNAIRPLFIIIGDESPHGYVEKEHASRFARVSLEKRMKASEVFEELKKKFSVYFIQKPYGDETLTDGPLAGVTKRVHENWAAIVGEDHIALLADPSRVVDVIFGIMAREAGKVQYFDKELAERQRPEQVKTVKTALRTIHALPPASKSRRSGLGRSNSVTRRAKDD